MARFRARTSTTAGRTVVTLDGECDLEGRDALTEVLLDAVGSGESVMVDLTEVTFIDSSGVHALIVAHHAALDSGKRLAVRNATGAAAAVLDVTGVGELLRGEDPADD